jgi:hypothetical protein
VGFRGCGHNGVRTPNREPKFLLLRHTIIVEVVHSNLSVACSSNSRGSHNCSQQSGPVATGSERMNEPPKAATYHKHCRCRCRPASGRPSTPGGLGGLYQGIIISTAIPSMIRKRSNDLLRVL